MRSPLTDSTTLANPISGHFRGVPLPNSRGKPETTPPPAAESNYQHTTRSTPAPGGHSLFPWNANHFSSPVFGLSQGGHPHPGHRNRPPQQPLTPATLEHHGKIEFVKTNPENPTTRWYFREPPPGPKLISSFRPAPRWHKTIYTPTEHRRTPPPTKQQNTRSTGVKPPVEASEPYLVNSLRSCPRSGGS